MRLSCFFVFISATLAAQPIQLEADAQLFLRLLSIRQAEAEQIDSIIQLGVAYSYTNKDSCLQLGEHAVSLSEQYGGRDLYARALLELGDSYRIFKNLEKAEVLVRQAKAIFEDLDDQPQIAAANNILGALMKNRGDNEAAIRYYLHALQIWEALQDTQNILKPYINISAAFFSSGRPQKAIAYNEKALQLAEIIDDDRAKSYIANNMGIIYNSLALQYRSMADTSKNNYNIYRDSTSLFVDEALRSYELALELARRKKDQPGIVRISGNIVDLKITKGEYREALELSQEVAQAAAATGATASILRNAINQAEIYRLLGRFSQSIKIGKEALQMARELQMERDAASAHQELYLAYKGADRPVEALSSLEALKAYTDKNGATERNKAIAEVEARYQNVQKEKQILAQRNDILQLETQRARIQKQRNFLAVGTLLFAILGFFGFQLNRVRQERNDKIAFAEALIFAQEEERKRIARDLHDGIGQSLLLIKKRMAAHLDITLENRQLISDTLDEVRAISRDLHPFQLQQLGMTAAVEDVIRRVSASSGVFITKELGDLDDLLPAPAAIHLFRVIQEALSNVVKHAEATAAKVTASHTTGLLLVRIQDNGKGFDHELKIARSKSMGLRTMYERIAAIGGKFTISRGDPKGTVIDIRLPLPVQPLNH